MMSARKHQGISMSQLLSGIAAVSPREDVVVTGLCIDSRKIEAGDCFVALAGSANHGAAFAHEAVAAGAVAVLLEDAALSLSQAVPVIHIENLRGVFGDLAARFYEHPSAQIATAAVTGTNGKTTVAYLIAQALAQLHGQCGYAGTLGIGTSDSLRHSINTTPDALSLQAWFDDLRNSDCRFASLEVSSHAIDQNRISGSEFDVAVFTNLSHDHLDYHKTMARYAETKQALFRHPRLRHAVVNIDDECGRAIAYATRARLELSTFSIVAEQPSVAASRHYQLLHRAVDHTGMRLTIGVGEEVCEIATPLVGEFNAQNLLAALGALVALGVPLKSACDALSTQAVIEGRMELINRDDAEHAAVYIDYAHTPDSLERALIALRECTPGRLICVFGCGGDRDASKRAAMGRAAEQHADVTFLTSDNPRSESNECIVEEILCGMQRPDAANLIHDRRLAIEAAIAHAEVGDTILVAGKGHERTQEIAGQRYDFSDREVALASCTRGRA